MSSVVTTSRLRKTGQEMPWHVISIVRIDAGFATCHGNAGFGSRVRHI